MRATPNTMPASTPRTPPATTTFLPSSDPAVSLEARLTLKPGVGARAPAVLVIAHPHGLLGGSLRDPVAAALASRGAASPAFAAVCRVNARGVGRSEGGRAVGLGAGPADLLAVAGAVVAAVERERASVAGEGSAPRPPRPPPRVHLAGYSWGACVSAAAAAAASASSAGPAPSPPVAAVAAVSPPLGLAPSLALGASRAFAALADAPATSVLAVIGDRDQFASAGRVVAAVEKVNSARARAAASSSPSPSPPASAECVVVEGADHFWGRDEDGAWAGDWGAVAAQVVAWCEAVEAGAR